MNSYDDDQDEISRRSFLLSSGGLFTSLWVASQWPSIAAAAHHAEEMPTDLTPAHFEFFTAADGADVEAIAGQIVPSGATPGAREAHAVYFIDRSLSTYFAAMAPEFRKGLQEFQDKYQAVNPSGSFASAPLDAQMAYLKTVDRTPFFETTRMLTVLGLFTSPKYGGNYQGSGWKMMGFVDQHAFRPPFGHYDAEYKGFVPYSPEKHA
jgi:hypothetical protein